MFLHAVETDKPLYVLIWREIDYRARSRATGRYLVNIHVFRSEKQFRFRLTQLRLQPAFEVVVADSFSFEQLFKAEIAGWQVLSTVNEASR